MLITQEEFQILLEKMKEKNFPVDTFCNLEMGDEQIIKIAEKLKDSKIVFHLNLSGNLITSQSIEALVNIIREGKTALVYLDLTGIEMTENIEYMLFDLITRNHNIIIKCDSDTVKCQSDKNEQNAHTILARLKTWQDEAKYTDDEGLDMLKNCRSYKYLLNYLATSASSDERIRYNNIFKKLMRIEKRRNLTIRPENSVRSLQDRHVDDHIIKSKRKRLSDISTTHILPSVSKTERVENSGTEVKHEIVLAPPTFIYHPLVSKTEQIENNNTGVKQEIVPTPPTFTFQPSTLKTEQIESECKKLKTGHNL